MLHRLKTDFRLSIITLLGASAILGITPFAAMRFMQGNTLAGSVDTAILVGILITLIYAWASGDTRRSGLVLAVIACSGAVTVGAVVGEPGLFWLYPCLVTTFFLANPRIAVFLNVASVVVLMIHGGAFRSDVQMWSFASTAFVVSACAYVFAHRNHDQRERLEHLATIDPLTGIKNRRSMDQELDLAAANAERTGLPYALVLLDIDHFKRINDEHGHGVGDDVLTDLVALLKQNTRKSDQLFRYGGEEFVLLLPGVDGIGLKAVMNNLQQVLRKYMKHPGGAVTASFGVALLRHGEGVDSWLARADAALYEAKETGRDRIVFADLHEAPEPAADAV
ncbi:MULTISPECIES: GGDEF domain-containing protein [Marinobacter]|jgi:diguanylate cyclase (GGDEF)-like protein|uniref:diguanylate cyclase n=2 Tax=Marinobacter TaxID=2742 RepID=A0A5M3PNV1_9GAMM|nr:MULTISPECIES: GGDEF domain-containing protein [Marinobacter]MBO6810108.1 GGDEF domain-containing protein [Marinobacter sp.]MBO6872056.1 GGDEF domain-containing protein [Marinobacter sp.]MBY6072266.1 GGDEF domain-containing protein [Marinobacter salsuginis]QTN42381.1 GGDEF domain-containing protein [Marinobacter salsuginis]GBO84593.1 GGDEF domain-containing protein [Marinobacter salsuginis]